MNKSKEKQRPFGKFTKELLGFLTSQSKIHELNIINKLNFKHQKKPKLLYYLDC